jgi:hypothetical protein
MDDLLGFPVGEGKNAQTSEAENRKLWESVTNPRTYIVLSCITCQRLVLFNTDYQDLFTGDCQTPTSLFCITVCAACEQEENEDSGKDRNDSTWTNLSIHKDHFSLYQRFSTMSAYVASIGEHLTLETNEDKVPLRHRHTVKDLIEGEYNVNSVLIDPTEGVLAEILPYIEKGFFKVREQ